MSARALAALGTSIFSEMTALANAHGAVNLSQGFPDFEGPAAIVDDAVAALRAGHNQYGRSMGVLPLVHAVARHEQRATGLVLDPVTEIVCTAGATEALAAAMIGLLEPGDEVLLLEPFYDGYPAVLAMVGAVPKVATLRWPDFRVPLDELRALVTDRTRMIVVNTPHNPTGRVLGDDELDGLARLCVDHDLIALCDEVYEHLTYGVPHNPLRARPGMQARTVSVSSTGKTFSFTGWKVGWATGPAPLIAGVQRAHQFLTFCASTPLHVAMGHALDRCDDAFTTTLQAEYRARRDFVTGMLRDAGFAVAVPDGAYFCLADIRGLTDDDDRTFARRLITEAGVAAIPPSAFYSRDVNEGRRLLRFAFCKTQGTLDEAARRLSAWAKRR
ncbi:MAG: aminotransferase class I/II-fold pyridoxal phosphate-dependent enzyme [Deltaproteobacteria bacterium]|nr:aminotransferase class I/II-fold pyridoxal phosphate-dependent enzyme [Deltaproteobacteria bacterium]